MSKWAPYWETFRRHRYLLFLPIVVAVVIAAWFALGSATSYQSTASVWVENPSPTAASLPSNANLGTPAQQEQSILTELLSTRSFVLTVGHKSPLASYLATHGSSGWSPTALLSGMGGGGSVDGRIVAALGGKNVASTVAGPQVLQVTYRAPTPSLAAGTLGTLVTQLQQASASYKAGSGFHLVDPPSAGTSVTSHKKQLLTIVGGLFAGALISLLATVALTPGKPDPWEDGGAASVATLNGSHEYTDAVLDGVNSVGIGRTERLSYRARVASPGERKQPERGDRSTPGDLNAP